MRVEVRVHQEGCILGQTWYSVSVVDGDERVAVTEHDLYPPARDRAERLSNRCNAPIDEIMTPVREEGVTYGHQGAS